MDSLETLGLEVLPAVLMLVGIVAGVLVRHFFKDKEGMAAEKLATEQLIETIVTQGINYAEKIAEQRRKANSEIGSQEKLYMAIDYIEELLESSGLAEIGKKQLEARIEAALNKEGV